MAGLHVVATGMPQRAASTCCAARSTGSGVGAAAGASGASPSRKLSTCATASSLQVPSTCRAEAHQNAHLYLSAGIDAAIDWKWRRQPSIRIPLGMSLRWECRRSLHGKAKTHSLRTPARRTKLLHITTCAADSTMQQMQNAELIHTLANTSSGPVWPKHPVWDGVPGAGLIP